MSPGINVCTRKWHPQYAEIAQVKQKGPGQLLFSSLSTCSNRLLKFCNLHSFSWMDLHWSLINFRLRVLGLARYTPLVEVNQAIFAWSFRQPCWNISLLPSSGHKLSEVNAKNKQKSLQHPVFPGGHPSKYSQGSMLLNFSDQTRTGAFNMIWSKTFKIDFWHSVGFLYPLRKCTKLWYTHLLLKEIKLYLPVSC